MENRHDAWSKQLADLLEVLQHQNTQIEQLISFQETNKFVESLRAALVIAATRGTVGSPSAYSATLESVVETASDILDATAASLFLLDEKEEELIFVVALGEKADQVKQFRVPVGEGIAGFVAATGQAIAIADAEKDSRFDRSIGDSIGYIPNTILCVPLISKDNVIGVLELMDKVGGSPFSSTDMEALGRFADLAAHTIEESRLTHNMTRLFRWLLTDGLETSSISDTLLQFSDAAADDFENSSTLQAAGLLYEISLYGEHANALALEGLRSMLRYLSQTSGHLNRN